MNVLVFLVLAIIALVARAAPPSAGDCALKCNDMRTEVLTMEMCRYVVLSFFSSLVFLCLSTPFPYIYYGLVEL